LTLEGSRDRLGNEGERVAVLLTARFQASMSCWCSATVCRRAAIRAKDSTNATTAGVIRARRSAGIVKGIPFLVHAPSMTKSAALEKSKLNPHSSRTVNGYPEFYTSRHPVVVSN
jgi:hypothetical protein